MPRPSNDLHQTLARLSADIFGPDQHDLLARLQDVPMHEWPRAADCWHCSIDRVRVDGRRTLVRYVLYDLLRGFNQPGSPALVRTCPTTGCVNPVHHTESRKPRRGRPGVSRPAPAPKSKPLTHLLSWPDADLYSALLILPPDKWPDEAKQRCWGWAGPTFKHKRGLPVPRIRNRPAAPVIWEIFNKQPVPTGHVLRRTCTSRSCVNPHHGRLATRSNPWLTPASPAAPTGIPAHLLDEDAPLSQDEIVDMIEHWLGTIHAPTADDLTHFLLSQQELRPFRQALTTLDAPELRNILPQLGWATPP